jgi:hypothetical protein
VISKGKTPMAEQTNYDKRIVAFIDILGFSNLLDKTRTKDNNGKEADNAEEIKKLSVAFNRIRELMGVDEPNDDVPESRMVTQFSDSIVISFDPKQEPREFKYLLGELLYLHIELAKSDILIRGGIYYGPLIHTDKILFGPALVNAYNMERKAANSPRIILPQSLYKKDSRFQELFTHEPANRLNDLLSLDEDDFYYLDYFDKCQNPELLVFTSDMEYIGHMRQLKTIIVEGLKNKQPGIYSKYGWMKTKWNRTIKKYKTKQHMESIKKNKRNELADYFERENEILKSL